MFADKTFTNVVMQRIHEKSNILMDTPKAYDNFKIPLRVPNHRLNSTSLIISCDSEL